MTGTTGAGSSAEAILDEQLADLDVQSTGDALQYPRGGVLLAAFNFGEV